MASLEFPIFPIFFLLLKVSFTRVTFLFVLILSRLPLHFLLDLARPLLVSGL